MKSPLNLVSAACLIVVGTAVCWVQSDLDLGVTAVRLHVRSEESLSEDVNEAPYKLKDVEKGLDRIVCSEALGGTDTDNDLDADGSSDAQQEQEEETDSRGEETSVQGSLDTTEASKTCCQKRYRRWGLLGMGLVLACGLATPWHEVQCAFGGGCHHNAEDNAEQPGLLDLEHANNPENATAAPSSAPTEQPTGFPTPAPTKAPTEAKDAKWIQKWGFPTTATQATELLRFIDKYAVQVPDFPSASTGAHNKVPNGHWDAAWWYVRQIEIAEEEKQAARQKTESQSGTQQTSQQQVAQEHGVRIPDELLCRPYESEMRRIVGGQWTAAKVAATVNVENVYAWGRDRWDELCGKLQKTDDRRHCRNHDGSGEHGNDGPLPGMSGGLDPVDWTDLRQRRMMAQRAACIAAARDASAWRDGCCGGNMCCCRACNCDCCGACPDPRKEVEPARGGAGEHESEWGIAGPEAISLQPRAIDDGQGRRFLRHRRRLGTGN